MSRIRTDWTSNLRLLDLDHIRSVRGASARDLSASPGGGSPKVSQQEAGQAGGGSTRDLSYSNTGERRVDSSGRRGVQRASAQEQGGAPANKTSCHEVHLAEFADSNSFPHLDSNGSISEELRLAHHQLSGVEQPCGTKRPIRIIAVGAGASGIDLAYAVKTRTENVQLTIFEKLSGVGGCWLTSRYPGVACDIPAVNYAFTWRPNIWSNFYASGPEILKYFESIVADEALERYMKLSHEVLSANWDQDTGLWTVAVRGPDGVESSHQAEVLMNATGFLSSWEWPKIAGLEDFKGELVHSAKYPETLVTASKRVAVIGAGSSAVQIISTISPTVDHLFTWVRSPVWVTPAYASQYAGPNGANLEFSEETRQRFKDDPAHYLEYRKNIEDQLNRRWPTMLVGSQQQVDSHATSLDLMKKRLNYDERLVSKIVPTNFAPGCRRPMPGIGYLESLVKPSTTTYTSGISQLTEKGFLDPDGKEVPVDVVICATGLNTSFRPRFPIIANGQDLSEVWKGYPNCYLSLGAPDFPNYFIYFGPHGPYAHGSALPVAEALTTYFLQMVNKMQVEGIKSFVPTQDATRDFMEHHDLLMKRTVWHGACSAWYTVPPYVPSRPDGPAPLLYPGSRVHLLQALAVPRYEDFEYTRISTNRFQYFGDGFHIREFNGSDLTWYFGLLDGKDESPDYTSIDAEYNNTRVHADGSKA